MKRKCTSTYGSKLAGRCGTVLTAVCMAAALTACGGEGGSSSAGSAGMGETTASGGMSSGKTSAEGEAAGSGTASSVPDGAGQTPGSGRFRIEDFEIAELPQPYARYMEILEMIRDEGRDPNGREYESNADWNFENNCFAILDVDRDGRQELIFNFNESFMGAMCEVVYEYDEETDTLREELVEWVSTEYYSGGLVKVECSHNHGRDPEGRGEWPYSVYEYDPETDSYRQIYMMDPWDGRIHEEDFPDELDTDGDKLLYCVTVENGSTAAGTAADGQVMIFDQDEYEAWAEELMPEWSRMDVTYHPMTGGAIENVKSAYIQAKLYAAQAEKWFIGEDAGPFSREYLLYDLDGDGSLELTSSIMQGTGRYSDNHFYCLTDRGEAAELPLVRLCDSREREWASDFDIGGRTRIQAYQDRDGTIYYEGNDYTRDGIFGGYDETGFYYLKDGVVYQDSIRQREEIFHDGDGQEDEIYYFNMTTKADGTAEEITKEQYETIQEDYVKDMTEVRVYQNWTYFSWDEITQGEISEETICRKLFGSYLGSE